MDFDPQNSQVSRRTVIAAGAAGLLAAAMRPLRAKPVFEVPEVDSLSLQVIGDSATFGPFLPNLDLPGLKVLRAGNGGPPHMPRMLPRALIAESAHEVAIDSTMCQAHVETEDFIDFPDLGRLVD